MAKDLMRSGGNDRAGKAVTRAGQGSSLKKHAKKPAKKAAKHAAKKHAKKAAKHATEPARGLKHKHTDDLGMMTAFHHMQRASIVISLMEKDTGEDLRELLGRGVKLYRKALEEEERKKTVLRAIGVLRAAEHLALAGLYAAREVHRQKVPPPGPRWLVEFIEETNRRLDTLEYEERGKGVDLFPATGELLRRAEAAGPDAHLAFELAMAADALCFAMENGL